MPQNHKKRQNEQPPHPSYDGLNTPGMVESLARSELVQLLLVTSFGCLSLMYTFNLFCWYYIIIIFDYRKNRKEELAEISSIMHTNECSLRNVNWALLTCNTYITVFFYFIMSPIRQLSTN